jgi:HPt (histidine-containing phosphotransfer) domain-containing protein
MTTRKELDDLTYSLAELRMITSGDEKALQEMVNLFIEQTGIALQEVRTHFTAGDYQQMFNALHKMKPSVHVMGLNPVYQLILQIEQMKKDGISSSQLESDLVLLDKHLKKILKELKNLKF